MKEELLDMIKIISYIVISTIAVVSLLILIANPFVKWNCLNKGEIYNVSVKYDTISGCFVKANGNKYIPMNHYEESTTRVMNVNVME
jgi:hypothetical protein